LKSGKDAPPAQEGKTTTNTANAKSRENSRRNFLKEGAALAAGTAAGRLLPSQLVVRDQSPDAGLLGRLVKANASGQHIILRDGIIYTVDWHSGDFEKGDVLIQGKKIVAVGPNLEAPKSAVVVNAAGMIVMPGMIDTHHHQYETVLRSILADGIISVGGLPAPKNNYASVILSTFTPVYTPEDAHIAELLASLSQINDGVTTSVDTSQVQLTPEHTDACIAGLRESGRRAVFAYEAGGQDAAAKFPIELTRLQKQYFSSEDQLLTLASSGGNPQTWKFARSLQVPLVLHVIGTAVLDSLAQENLMGPDCEYIHCTRLPEEAWKKIADTGGKVSIAPAIEMQMQHGYPPFQQALDHALGPSLSVDVECNMTADLFSVMRAALTMQHGFANERIIAKENPPPRLVTCREVIEFATVYAAIVARLFSKIGALTPGKEADIVMLATDRINVFPLNNVPGAIVTLMDTTNVENVFIAGKIRKWRGQLVGVDLARIRTQAEKSRDGLLARAKYPRDLFSSCCLT